MSSLAIHTCECPLCFEGEQYFHHAINLFASRLDEQQRRWFAALEAKRLGFGGEKKIAQIVGIDAKTIRRGRRELESELEGRPEGRARVLGAGRPSVEREDPTVETALLEMLEPETAGDPMGTVRHEGAERRP